MFHRRLAMLGVGILVAAAGLAVQLGRLTLVQGEARREEAEKRLVMREWTPPTGAARGKILDRKGRVLAQNRPSFDVVVDYRSITGEWARKRASDAARKTARWRDLSLAEREELVEEFERPYRAHLERMWLRVASAAGKDADKVEGIRKDIVERVDSKVQHQYAALVARDMEDRLKRGEEISADPEEAQDLEKRLRRPIAEQRAAHVLLANVDDETGFELLGLQAEVVELGVPDGSGGMRLEGKVPLLPGLEVVPSGERDYPYDSVTVELDTRTIPETVRAAMGMGASGPKEIKVHGVAYHVLGKMKDEAQKEDSDRRSLRVKGRKAKQGEGWDVPPDAAFAERVLTRMPIGAGRTGSSPESSWDRGRYFDADAAGQSGIEASREDDLRGLRGLRITRLDTGETVTVPSERGRDVRLTIDVMLQARVAAAMSGGAGGLGLAVAQEWHGHENPTVPVGTPLNGAAVVMEVDTGDILAMVSTPSVSRTELREDAARFFGDPMNRAVEMPWIDRSIGRPYPPGSIAKAMVLNGAVKLGKHSLESHIECTGHLFPDKPNMFRCWIFKSPVAGHTTHTRTMGHALSAPEALMVSCNIYFFTVGQRLGAKGIVETYRMFGLGEPWNLGLEPRAEFGGFLGYNKDDPAPASAPGRIDIHDAIQMGIGQGPVAWTPLHAADAYCTLARGGVRIKPHVVSEPTSPETVDIGLDKRAVKEAMEGLWKSVNEDPGTGNHVTIDGKRVHHFTVPNVVIWGKTGTAAAPTVFVDPTVKDEDGKDVPNPLWDKGVDAATIGAAMGDPAARPFSSRKRALRWGDHSWYVVLVGPKAENRPKYAIAVMMEYAGSGGKVSGPIVNQVIHALVAEGYL